MLGKKIGPASLSQKQDEVQNSKCQNEFCFKKEGIKNLTEAGLGQNRQTEDCWSNFKQTEIKAYRSVQKADRIKTDQIEIHRKWPC